MRGRGTPYRVLSGGYPLSCWGVPTVLSRDPPPQTGPVLRTQAVIKPQCKVLYKRTARFPADVYMRVGYMKNDSSIKRKEHSGPRTTEKWHITGDRSDMKRSHTRNDHHTIWRMYRMYRVDASVAAVSHRTWEGASHRRYAVYDRSAAAHRSPAPFPASSFFCAFAPLSAAAANR